MHHISNTKGNSWNQKQEYCRYEDKILLRENENV